MGTLVQKGEMMFLAISDTHFGHENILNFERRDIFKNIEEHDNKLVDIWKKCLRKLGKDDTFYFLGDFCAYGQEQKYIKSIFQPMNEAPCHKVMIMGNHDKSVDKELLYTVFDEVCDYPIYVSHRVVLSHFPCAVYPSQVNVHGHTHGMKLYGNNHICASIHVNNYNPVSSKNVESALGKIANWNTKFLYEPWAEDYQLTQHHDDAIADADGHIDLSASRLMMRLKCDRIKTFDSTMLNFAKRADVSRAI